MKRTLLGLALLGLVAACGGDDASDADAGPPDATPPGGTISLSWTINSGGAATCADVGAQLVVLELIRQGEGAGEVDTFNCTASEGTTRELKVGTYDVSIDLVDGSANSLLDAPIEENSVDVTANGDSDLGSVIFDL